MGKKAKQQPLPQEDPDPGLEGTSGELDTGGQHRVVSCSYSSLDLRPWEGCLVFLNLGFLMDKMALTMIPT